MEPALARRESAGEFRVESSHGPTGTAFSGNSFYERAGRKSSGKHRSFSGSRVQTAAVCYRPFTFSVARRYVTHVVAATVDGVPIPFWKSERSLERERP